MVYFKTWLLFVRCIFCYTFSIKNSSLKSFNLAGKSLFGQSFRYPEKDKKRFAAFFSYFLRALKSPKISFDNSCQLYSAGGSFFYDVSKTSEKYRTQYLDYFLKRPINGGIWKEPLLGYFTFLGKMIQLLFLFLLFLVLLPISLFSSLPASLGLIFIEYIETTNLVLVSKKIKIEVLYYFCIYEKDSNIATLALQETGIKVVKIPSEVPLYFWNKIVIADTLIICDSNQLEELERYKDTIQVKETEFWGPERCVEVMDRYKSKSLRDKADNKTIGLYSTASYIRKMEGHLVQKDMLEQEDNLKLLLSEYLRMSNSLKLLIFLHPKEKDTRYADTVKAHYSKYFEGLNYELLNLPEPSSHYLELIELGISFYSTIIYERLFFGFKCLLFTAPDAEFPLPGTALSNICAFDKNTLFNKIQLFLGLENDEYFSRTKIEKSPLFQNS